MTSSTGSWLPDPKNPAQLRWHDGTTWTDHTHSPQPTVAPQVAVQPVATIAAQPMIPMATPVMMIKPVDPRPSAKGGGVASMVLGICGLVFGFFCWPVGFICAAIGLPLGWTARSRIVAGTHAEAGRGPATAGMVMCLISVGLALLGLMILGSAISMLS